MTVYAVNLFDLVGIAELGPGLLIGPVIGRQVDLGGDTVDNVAITLDCEQDRAEAIVYVLRKKFEWKRLRVYSSISGNGGWKPVKTMRLAEQLAKEQDECA